MIYSSDLQQLLNDWIARSKSSKYSDEYKKAVAECAFELQTTIDNYFNEETEALQYLDEQYADYYLSSIESHERNVA